MHRIQLHQRVLPRRTDGARYYICLLYWYNSTNTDAKAGTKVQILTQKAARCAVDKFASPVLLALLAVLVQRYINTDARGAARCAVDQLARVGAQGAR